MGSLPHESLGDRNCDQWEKRTEKIQSQNYKCTSGLASGVTVPSENQISNLTSRWLWIK